MSARRAGASVALLGATVAVVVTVYVFAVNFPRGLVVLACVNAGLAVAWTGLLRRGAQRWLGIGAGAVLLAAGLVVLANGGHVLELVLVAVATFAAVSGARVAFRPNRSLPLAEPPRRPVLFVNPRSGDGRAARVGLADEARRRGIEVVELGEGEDLAALVRAAVAGGADALAMAGGDGSQALVASIAAEHRLPYACVPAGTRNHFALDLGVDRDDVVGALDAFRDGGERLVDLAEVNGRVFVNNVSLGVYADAVSQDGYRQAKLRTLLETLSETLGPEADPGELRWRDPEGREQVSTALVLVSNNPYRLGPTLGSGTRPRLDTGRLGIVDFQPPAASEGSGAPRWHELTASELEVTSNRPIPLGVDGEAISLEPPLRFRIRPQALRVRIARGHPGASPSADLPAGLTRLPSALVALALGREINAR